MEKREQMSQFQACYLEILFSSSSYEEAILRLRTNTDVASYFKGYELTPAFVEMALKTFKYHALYDDEVRLQTESDI